MGKPLPGREVTLLDLDSDEPVEQGEVGEIAVRSTDEVPSAKSYFEMPEKPKRRSVMNGSDRTISLVEAKTATSGTSVERTTSSFRRDTVSVPRRSRTA